MQGRRVDKRYVARAFATHDRRVKTRRYDSCASPPDRHKLWSDGVLGGDTHCFLCCVGVFKWSQSGTRQSAGAAVFLCEGREWMGRPSAVSTVAGIARGSVGGLTIFTPLVQKLCPSCTRQLADGSVTSDEIRYGNGRCVSESRRQDLLRLRSSASVNR